MHLKKYSVLICLVAFPILIIIIYLFYVGNKKSEFLISDGDRCELNIYLNRKGNKVKFQIINEKNKSCSVWFKALHRDGIPYQAFYVPPDSVFFLKTGGEVYKVESNGLNISIVEIIRKVEKVNGEYSVTEKYLIKNLSDTIITTNSSFVTNNKYNFQIYNDIIHAYNSVYEDIPVLSK